jgi:hypothetical protein
MPSASRGQLADLISSRTRHGLTTGSAIVEALVWANERGGDVRLIADKDDAVSGRKRLLAFFRRRLITLAGSSLAIRGRPWPEAEAVRTSAMPGLLND